MDSYQDSQINDYLVEEQEFYNELNALLTKYIVSGLLRRDICAALNEYADRLEDDIAKGVE